VALTLLVLRALGLGDALTAVPALTGLRRARPQARLVLAGPPDIGAWFRDLGLVDGVLSANGRPRLPDVLEWPLTWRRPDLAVNLHGCGPQSHRLLSGLHPRRLVAFACPEAQFLGGPPWREEEHEVDRWCRLVQSIGGTCGRGDLFLPAELRSAPSFPGPTALVHPGAGSPARRWPVAGWAAVVTGLAARGWRVVVTGLGTEAPLCAEVAAAGAVDLCGRQRISDLAGTVAGSGLVVTGDTGVAHLATALRRPSVLLFGPTSPDRWGPSADPALHRVLWHPEVASAADPHGSAVDPRLAAITSEEVLAAVDVVAPVSGSF
jgi:ADP-heptose:LPS heptosyltransferase